MNNNLENVIEYLKDIDARVVGGGRKTQSCINKPNFYIVCPCCKSQKPLCGNGLGAFVNVNVGHRPFDSFKNFNTYFDTVKAFQGSLTPAYKLYNGEKGARSPHYICHEHNKKNLYILSTAWGIVNSEFELPEYNVTFSADDNTALQSDGEYEDTQWRNGMSRAFNELATLSDKSLPVVMMGGDSYIRRFLFLSRKILNPVVIFTRKASIIEECKRKKIPYVKANTDTRTNWYYKYMEII